MIRLTKLADYGIVLMTAVARDLPEDSFTAGEIAQRLTLPLPTIAKLLKLLTRGGLLRSQQGPRGGYQLARKAGTISVAELIEVLEGPVALTECTSVHHASCRHAPECGVRGHWGLINRRVVATLRAISLAEMTDTPQPLSQELPLVADPSPATSAPPEADSIPASDSR